MKASRNDSRIMAACITALIALLLAGLLIVARLRVKATAWPPPDRATEIIEADEEFVDLFNPSPAPSDPAPAAAKAPESGITQAPAADPEPVREDVKPAPQEVGPTAEEIERTEQRQRARQGVSDAFRASASDDDGDESPVNGTGSGTVGGGWIMPAYAKVDSRLTGSIIIQAVIDRTGRVVSVGQIGGKAPASADRRLVERCLAEVRRHAFTRSDDNAPDRATARITYYFR